MGLRKESKTCSNKALRIVTEYTSTDTCTHTQMKVLSQRQKKFPILFKKLTM